MTDNILECRSLSKRFGGVIAVNDFNFSLKQDELCGIIGPNGAGKTTIFNLISGVYKPDGGDILLEGRSLSKLTQEDRADLGVARTFQNTRLFNGLTVIDNVKTALDSSGKYTIIEALLRLPRVKKEEKRIEEASLECLELLNLSSYANERPQNLPYGIQRRVEIARALVRKPKLLMLDEPCAGLNSEEEKELISFIELIREKFGPSILVIEHSMDFVMSICEKICVQNFGNTIACGTPEEIKQDPEVRSAYLGEAVE